MILNRIISPITIMAKRGQGFLHSFYFFFLVHLTLMGPFPNKKKHVLVLKLRLEQKQTKSTLFLLFLKLTLSFDTKQKWQQNCQFWLQLKTSCFQTKRKKNNFNLLEKLKTHSNLHNERNRGSEITNIWRVKVQEFLFFWLQQQSLFVFLDLHQEKTQLYVHQQLSWPNRHILKQIKRKNLSFFLFEQKQNNRIFVFHWLQLLQRQSGKTNFLLLLNWFEQEVPFVFFFLRFLRQKGQIKPFLFFYFKQNQISRDNIEVWRTTLSEMKYKRKKKESYKIKLTIRFLRHQIVIGGFFLIKKRHLTPSPWSFSQVLVLCHFPPKDDDFSRVYTTQPLRVNQPDCLNKTNPLENSLYFFL